MKLPRKVEKRQKSALFLRQNVTLTCKHIYDDPGDVSWYKDSQFIQKSPTYIIGNGAYSESDEGSYQCEIKSEKSSPVKITTNQEKPHIENAPTKVNDGKPIFLHCYTVNPEHVFFRWFKNNSLIENTNTSSRDLKFKSFTYGNEGVYRCDASDNELLYVDPSNSVNITVVGKYELCKCKCPKGIEKMKLTEKQLEKKVDDIVQELTLERVKISKVKYTKQAIENEEKAVKLGKFIACVCFTLVFGTMLLLDLGSFVINSYAKYQKHMTKIGKRERINMLLQKEVVQLENPRWKTFAYNRTIPRRAKLGIRIST